MFLKEVIKKTKKYQQYSYSIKETHGTALWEYTYKPNVNGTGTNLGIQFQNGAFKVQVYQPNADNIVFWKKWNDGIIGIIKNELNKLGSIWKFNSSKKKGGAYYSFSLKKENDWFKEPTKEDIARHWDEMIQKCEKALDIIEGYC